MDPERRLQEVERHLQRAKRRLRLAHLITITFLLFSLVASLVLEIIIVLDLFLNIKIFPGEQRADVAHLIIITIYLVWSIFFLIKKYRSRRRE